MRDIKFRGKDKRTGIWAFGYYVGENTLIPADEVFYDIGYICDSKCNECFPDTLGQYTGLKDKNGKRIYEGDIVDVWSQGSHLPNGIIKWSESTASFFILHPQSADRWSLSGDNGKETLEVVGNIYDNPELGSYDRDN